jgi:hypothetical protein
VYFEPVPDNGGIFAMYHLKLELFILILNINNHHWGGNVATPPLKLAWMLNVAKKLFAG